MTDETAAREDDTMRTAVVAALEAIAGAGSIKSRMKAKGIRQGRCACPRCKEPGCCVATLAGPRDHLHMHCTKCGWRMMQ